VESGKGFDSGRLQQFTGDSQHFIFLLNYEWAQEAVMLHCTMLKRLSNDKHSSLLDPLVSFE
jgi:hypothetical protein